MIKTQNTTRYWLISQMRARYVTKQELMHHLDCNERSARLFIEDLRKTIPIISLSTGKGYKIACFPEDLNEAEQAVNEIRSRVINLYKNSKSLRLFLKQHERNIEPKLFEF